MTISARSETGLNVGVDVGKAQLDIMWHETGEHMLVENRPQGIRSRIKHHRKEAIERIVVGATSD